MTKRVIHSVLKSIEGLNTEKLFFTFDINFRLKFKTLFVFSFINQNITEGLSRDFDEYTNGQNNCQISPEEDQTVDDNDDECEETEPTLSVSPLFDDCPTDDQELNEDSNHNSIEVLNQSEDNARSRQDLDDEELVEQGVTDQTTSDNTVSDTNNSEEQQNGSTVSHSLPQNLCSNSSSADSPLPKPTVRTIVPAIEVMPAPTDDQNCGQNSGHNSSSNPMNDCQEVSHRRLERVGHPKNHRRTVSIGKEFITSFKPLLNFDEK